MEKTLTLTVDGKERTATIDTRVTLLDLLREHLGVIAPKKGCDHGQCGSCTVLLDGRRVTTCLAFAVQHDGAEIVTASGLGTAEAPHAMQRAFLDHDGYQCGYCTPGQICSAVGMLDELDAGWPSHVTADVAAAPERTKEEIRERMSGNLCRCGAYVNIVAAIETAAGAMRAFDYERASDAGAAVALVAGRPGAAFLGGGTNLVDHMKLGIAEPDLLVDVSKLPLDFVEPRDDGGIRIGAAVRNSVLAADPLVRERYAVLSEALVAAASGQLRNLATTAGNLLQRTRCVYFQDRTTPCNKRDAPARPGCSALEGHSRELAILGASDTCLATHPSDMAVAMAALDAVVRVHGPDGEREVPLDELLRLPGDAPERDTTLAHGELITAVDLPPVHGVSTYRKVRDRSSYAFALVSVAAVLDVRGGEVVDVRIALGGVAHKPWRCRVAEDRLRGGPATEEAFRAAAEAELEAASPQEDNAFKVPLARNTVVATLRDLAGRH